MQRLDHKMWLLILDYLLYCIIFKCMSLFIKHFHFIHYPLHFCILLFGQATIVKELLQLEKLIYALPSKIHSLSWGCRYTFGSSHPHSSRTSRHCSSRSSWLPQYLLYQMIWTSRISCLVVHHMMCVCSCGSGEPTS